MTDLKVYSVYCPSCGQHLGEKDNRFLYRWNSGCRSWIICTDCNLDVETTLIQVDETGKSYDA